MSLKANISTARKCLCPEYQYCIVFYCLIFYFLNRNEGGWVEWMHLVDVVQVDDWNAENSTDIKSVDFNLKNYGF